MISIDGKINVAFSNMGLFDTEADWIHPTVTINTYELIFVTEGEVKIREKEKNFRFKKGDMLLLEPGLEHGGTEESRGHTANRRAAFAGTIRILRSRCPEIPLL